MASTDISETLHPRLSGSALLLVTIALATGLSACGDEGPPRGEVLVADAGETPAIVARPDGGVRYGERLTGEIVDAGPDGSTSPVGRVRVSSDGQRGLLGVAVDDDDRTFAAWTRPDGRLVVGQVAPDDQRLVWVGPASTDAGNGGHLAVSPLGDLVIGVGDLEAPDLRRDATAVNGKLLALDPEGPPDQEPTILSSGYTNPFAFTFTPGGDLWVFDNATRSAPERLLRGDVADAEPALERTEEIAPSGLVALDERRLFVCGFLSGTVEELTIDQDGRVEESRAVAEGCAFGLALLADGRLAFSDGDTLRAIDPG